MRDQENNSLLSISFTKTSIPICSFCERYFVLNVTSAENQHSQRLYMVWQQDGFDQAHKVPPSPVVHVRGLVDVVTENDLRQAVQCFGTINYVMNFPNRKMALIEFEDIQSAKQLVTYAQTGTLCVAGRPAKFNFSTSPAIKRPAAVEDHPNNVILMTVMNPRHPITVDVVNAVCSPHGNVLRIVIFRKNGVQAMVEFDSLDGASKAKLALHGADIYSNCCTIRAEYAKPNTLTVIRNDSDSWDYTANTFGREMFQNMSKPQPLLADPTVTPGPTPFGMGHGGRGGPGGMMQGGGGTDYSAFMGHGHSESFDYDRAMERFGAASSQSGPLLGGYDANFAMNAAFGGSMNPGCPDCVLMVYGINTQKMNCQKLFNLFCLYGNVLRVRFLKSKDGSAMVQMSDREGCERVIRMVSNTKLYESKIQLSFSKQTYLQDIGNPHQLPDGSLAYQNYTGSKNNRYNGPDAANKNRAQPPSAVQYFFNAPPNVEESVLLMAFAEANVIGPEKVTLFPPKSEKSSRGLLHFNDAESSTEALVCANNSKLPNPNGKAPYVLKLCFSNASKDF